MSTADFEMLARDLEASGEYRILRRLHFRKRFRDDTVQLPAKQAVILDAETTGLDTASDEVIELAMVRFEFDAADHIFRVVDTFAQLRDPGRPIPPEVTAINGITDEMVAGKVIEFETVREFVEPAALVIAHNAEFDRQIVERPWPLFKDKAWACSVQEVDWRGLGFEGANLAYLLGGIGLFHDKHQGADDCCALLEVLAHDDSRAFKALLESARKPLFRIWALDSPFSAKDAMKKRKYRWSDGTTGKRKSWWVDVPGDKLDAELDFLTREVFGRRVELPIDKITARERFSERG